MYSFSIVTQESLTKSELDSICLIKGVFGPYTMQQQREWIKYNIGPNDRHLLMYLGTILVGYLNIINIEMEIDNISTKAIGIGNVCVSEKGIGLGGDLMSYLSKFIVNNKLIGLLFCDCSNVGFYSKYGWDLLVPSLCTSETMIFMDGKPFEEISFSGQMF
ncbi:GNAT family N-acetyltransferase [Vibrio vulnificus]|nr:GNAT family N-acetyltransferase [Vibrio vulnificus]